MAGLTGKARRYLRLLAAIKGAQDEVARGDLPGGPGQGAGAGGAGAGGDVAQIGRDVKEVLRVMRPSAAEKRSVI